jgi:mevalonate pyrophosphate decarboxylase
LRSRRSLITNSTTAASAATVNSLKNEAKRSTTTIPKTVRLGSEVAARSWKKAIASPTSVTTPTAFERFPRWNRSCTRTTSEKTVRVVSGPIPRRSAR